MSELLGAILAVTTWATPQPAYSAGLLVVYGDDALVRANAEFRGYSLPSGCGLSAISPAMLGRLAWVRVPGGPWLGPCTVVDAVARVHAYESIFVRQEVAEVSRATAAALGFEYGGWGYVWFGDRPPADGPETKGQRWSDWTAPLPYAPPLAWDLPPYDRTPSFYPYPQQEPLQVCQ